MADDCPASTLEKRLRLSQLVEQRLSATRKAAAAQKRPALPLQWRLLAAVLGLLVLE